MQEAILKGGKKNECILREKLHSTPNLTSKIFFKKLYTQEHHSITYNSEHLETQANDQAKFSVQL